MGLFRRRALEPARVPLRTGIFTFQVVGAGWVNKGDEYWPTVEVAEWEQLGGKSRVTITDVTGVPREYRSKVVDLVGAWVPTAAVIWRALDRSLVDALTDPPVGEAASDE